MALAIDSCTMNVLSDHGNTTHSPFARGCFSPRGRGGRGGFAAPKGPNPSAAPGDISCIGANSWIRSRSLLLAAVASVLMLPSSSYGADGVHVVHGVGHASVADGDTARAEYEARASARINALESLGVKVSSVTYSDYKSVLDQVVVKRVQGFIDRDRVVGRSTNEDGMMEVVVEAWVRADLTEEELEKRRRALVVALDIHESVLDENGSEARDHPDRVVQETVKNDLIQRGFAAYTLRDIAEIQHLRKNLSAASGTTTGDLMDWTLAGVLIHGSVESRFSERGISVQDYFGRMQQGLYYRAFPRVKASEAAGTPIPEGSIYIAQGVKGYQMDPARAAREALTKCGSQVALKMAGALSEFARQNRVRFTLIVDGLPNVGRYRRLKRILGGLRWMAEASAGETFEAGGRATYNLVYEEKPFLLISQLHRLPGLEVVRFSGYEVVARYTGR